MPARAFIPGDAEIAMARAMVTRPDAGPRPRLRGCGRCTYVYSQTDGCYHRRSFDCAGDCTCAPVIRGLGSQILQRLFPASVRSAAGVSLACSPAGSDEESCANSLLDLIVGLAAATAFWKRACIGLGALSVLVAIGLVIALVYR
jgi:hypothetical protein